MKKSVIFGAALMLVSAFGLQSCSKEDNAGDATVDALAYDIANKADLSVLIDKYAENGVLTLPASAEITMAEEIQLNEPLLIRTAEGAKPAGIIAKAGFVTTSSLILENVAFEVSGVSTPFIKMNTLPTEGLNDAGAYEVDEISLINSSIIGLKNSLFYANKQKYLINEFNIDHCVIDFGGTTGKTIIDFNGGGLPLNVTIDQSMIGASKETSWSNGGLFSTQSGSNLAQVTTDADAKHTFTVTQSVLTCISNGKTLCTLRQNNQAWQYYVVKDNVVNNCGKKNEFLAGFCAGRINKKENWTASGNLVYFDDENTGAGEIEKSGLENACIVPETPAAE